jgi:hypothetical protein
MVRGGSRHCASEALGIKATKARITGSFRIITGVLFRLPNHPNDESVPGKIPPEISC